MIFKLSHLQGIKAGKITMAFRKWRKPSVREGSKLRTAMGVVSITCISETTPDKITNRDAVSAGFENRESLLKTLDKQGEGTIFRIVLQYFSEDPRIKLRQQTSLNGQEFEVIKKKLDRLDSYGREGNWTAFVLKTIGDNPRMRAADLAAIMDKEKDALKINIRKLKNLGLTISHDVGYTLSPLGEFVLKKIRSAAN